MAFMEDDLNSKQLAKLTYSTNRAQNNFLNFCKFGRQTSWKTTSAEDDLKQEIRFNLQFNT